MEIISELEVRSSSYFDTTEVKRTPISYENFLRLIIDRSSKTYFAVTSCLSAGCMLKKAIHLLCLDCDGLAESAAVAHMLKYMDINYVVINSSGVGRWLICDKSGPFADMLSLAHQLPGVDSKWLTLAGAQKSFFLRACPYKINGGDFMLTDAPCFPAEATFNNQQVANWYNDFKGLWQEEAVRRRTKAEWLHKHLKEGTLLAAAASPDFDL